MNMKQFTKSLNMIQQKFNMFKDKHTATIIQLPN
jgi:hypothetical protein